MANGFQTNGFQNNGFQMGGGFAPVSQGRFRFLKDHWIDQGYVNAGDVMQMFTPWRPTADVEPLDATAVAAFYAQGPKLGGVWRTLHSDIVITPPLTYWYAVAPNVWKLSGLGSTLAPIPAIIGRVEDKEP